jgi:exopolyphosphatase/guanosine-5'-triphosphate,3'-diphosphate pyrophosphatase
LREPLRDAVRVAAIDVGTNSTRLLVAEVVAGGFRPLDRRMTITRLGQGVDRRRALDPEALERTLRTVADYAATCGEYGVESIRVTGTSAVRDARNRKEFFEGVKMLTGREPELLSGEDEARTTFLGATADLSGEAVLVVDIGGGSTELISGRDQPEHLVSLDIGCVRMLEKHLHSDPPALERRWRFRRAPASWGVPAPSPSSPCSRRASPCGIRTSRITRSCRTETYACWPRGSNRFLTRRGPG